MQASIVGRDDSIHQEFNHAMWRFFVESEMMRDLSIKKVGTRAVDVGYFNVKYTLGRQPIENNATSIKVGMFPSLAPVLSSGVMMHSPGTLAADGCISVIGGVRFFVGNGAVFNSSGMEPRPILDDYCTSDKYLALLRGALGYMVKDAGSPASLEIEHLVLGLPLNTFNKYKDKLQAIAAGEHQITLPGAREHRVNVCNVTVLVQPQGALVNFGAQHREQNNGWMLVVDPGGGTLDWFLTRGRQPNWQRSGAYPKSMLACAAAVCDRINPDWKKQFEIIERIDEAIRMQSDSFRVGPQTYQMKDYRQSVDEVLNDSVRFMLGVVGATDNFDQILLTGGGAPVYFAHMQKSYPSLAKLVNIDNDPVYSNVRGFHLVGELITGQVGTNRTSMV